MASFDLVSSIVISDQREIGMAKSNENPSSQTLVSEVRPACAMVNSSNGCSAFSRIFGGSWPFVLVVSLSILSGCQFNTVKKSDKTHPGYGSDNMPYECGGGICSAKDVQPAYNKALMTCVNIQNHYELNNNKKSVFNLIISGVGALAGAVFAPLAKGSGTKAWAGLAGSTSAFQGQLEQEYSNLAFAQIRSAVVGQMIAGEAKYAAVNPSDSRGRVDVANEMAMNCRAVPGEAEKQIRQAISDAAKSTNASIANQLKAAEDAAKKSTKSHSSPDTPAGASSTAASAAGVRGG